MAHKFGIPCSGAACFTCDQLRQRRQIQAALRQPSPELLRVIQTRMLIPTLKDICKSTHSRLLHAEWVDHPPPEAVVYAPSQRYFLRMCRAAHGDDGGVNVPVVQKDMIALFQVLCAFDRLSVAAAARLKVWIRELSVSDDLLFRKLMQFPMAYECLQEKDPLLASEKLRVFMLDPSPYNWNPARLVHDWYACGTDDRCLAFAKGLQRDIALGRSSGNAYRKHEALEILIGLIKATGTTARRTAAAMAFHPRLGAQSGLGELPADVLSLIVSLAEPVPMLCWADLFKGS